ncbi:MAG: SDR family NAD(P)-dependent oxidoreductase, partial [Rhodobiaceae bacterium]
MTDPISLFDLTGKIACVTGASSGLGLRAADTLLAAGAQVVGVARREPRLAQWQAEKGQNAAFVVADVADRDNLDRLK